MMKTLNELGKLLPLLPLYLLIAFMPMAHADAPAIDLKNWNITLPVDSKGGKTGEAVELPAVGNVVTGPDASLVFSAPVDGAHTPGSKYARRELREMSGALKAAWNLATGGTMTATLTVDSVPALKDGSQGKEVIGQIHGKNDELVRLYWDAGRVYFHNDLSGSDGKEHEFKLLNSAGKEPFVPFGSKMSYLIDAHASTLTVKVWVNGDSYAYSGAILPVWQKDTLYFKAGVYLGENASQGATGTGQATFYALDFSHVPGQGLGGLPPAPTPPAAPAPKRTFKDVANDMQKLVNELQTMQ